MKASSAHNKSVPSRGKSRITNGNSLLPGIDGRSLWARRFRDLIQIHLSDRGGELACSEGEKALVRRAAAIITELERREVRFAEKGGASNADIECYQRAVNSLRRLLETLGLERRAKDVTPTEKANAMPSLVELMGAGE